MGFLELNHRVSSILLQFLSGVWRHRLRLMGRISGLNQDLALLHNKLHLDRVTIVVGPVLIPAREKITILRHIGTLLRV